MISQDQAKEMDKMELCEEVHRKLEILQLCLDGISSNHDGTVGIHWAFEDAETLIEEMAGRLREIPE